MSDALSRLHGDKFAAVQRSRRTIVGPGMTTPPHPITRRVLGMAALVTAAFGRDLLAQTPQQQAAAPDKRPAPDKMRVRLTVNGQARALDARPAHHAARRAARASRPHRHQERLRPRPVRRLHRAGERRAHQFLPVARGDARRRRDHHHRGPRHRPSKLHPLQAAFVKHDGFQCGYCTPGQICSAVGMLDEISAACPSHVTADLAAAPRAQRRRDPRAHERQHLPLLGLSQHRGGHHGSREGSAG